MKAHITIILLTSTLLILTIGHAQQHVKRADLKYNDLAYIEAIDSYERLLKMGYTNKEIYLKLGNANYYNAHYKEAKDWYEKLLTVQGMDTVNEYVYRYAQTLKSTGNYEEADQWMDKLARQYSNDLRFKKFKERNDYLSRIRRSSGMYGITSLPINSSKSEFAPSLYGNRLIFSSAKDKHQLTKISHNWNNQPFLDLYEAQFLNDSVMTGEVKKFGKNLNKKTHESSTAFTKDGKTIYFTRNNSKNGKFQRDKSGLSRLKIFKATLVDGKWDNVQELPFNGDSYSVANPALSPDEKLLFFSSDMPGSYGGSDIYKVDILEDGTYGKPQNLGPDINTEARETFPFITMTNELYFSSDGHPGLGGLDVFMSPLSGQHKGEVTNLGEPINSTQDDFSLTFDDTGQKGYFASNRDGGLGYDDIYAFEYLGITIEEPEQEEEPLITEVPEVEEKPELPNLEDLGLDKIFFDFDYFELTDTAKAILDGIVEILQKDNTVKLDIGAHTDAKGNQGYNQKLSEKRLHSTISYLKSNGIAASRLVGKAMGESKLANSCGAISNCGEEEHALNRRAEFILLRAE